MLGTHVPWELWAAALLTLAAIVLLQAGRHATRPSGATILLSLAAAAGYALFDVLVQKWSPVWGAGHFLPLVFGMSALFSCAFLPLLRGGWREVPQTVWPWLCGGALCGALQSMLLVSAIAFFGDATSMNVIYSARGLWSVAAVWLIGHWFQNTEKHLGSRVLRWRLAGAAFMTAAIVVTITRTR